MMKIDNPASINAASVNAVSRVDSVVATIPIATAAQDDVERAINRTINQEIELVKGEQYAAKVIAQRGKNTFDVEVAGFKLAMQLDDKTSQQLNKFLQAGQKLTLTYLGGNSPPKFQLPSLMMPSFSSNQQDATLSLSHAASLIKQSFQLANTQLQAASDPITSNQVMTKQPKNAELTAQSLQNTLVSSGLFYESHLANFVGGHYTLQALKQEPQNLLSANLEQKALGLQSQVQNLLPQQLAVLETQHFSWQGQVWPNQTMQWQVWTNVPQHNDSHEQNQPDSSTSKQEAMQKISSQLSLHLPNLGQVSIRLDYQNEKMRVNIQANTSQTKALLKDNSRHLISTMKNNGQPLESLLVG